MKILIAADTYPPEISGAGLFAQRLARGLARRGHEVHVVAASPLKRAFVEYDGDVTIHRLRSYAFFTHPTYRLCFPPQIKFSLARIIEEIQPDVVHTQCHYSVGRVAVREASQRGIRIVGTNHFVPDNIFRYLPFPNFMRSLIYFLAWKDLERVFTKVDVLTTPTVNAVHVLEEHTDLQNIVPISCGIDKKYFGVMNVSETDIKDSATILFVGRLAQEKHVEWLIEAFSLLPDSLGARLQIVGVGEQRESLEELSQVFDVSDRIDFLGHVDDADLRELYLRATVFCMPGTAELQSIATLEALSAGTPVVLADAMALPHLVVSGKNGFLFPPGDIKVLTDMLREILSCDLEKQALMREAALDMVQKHDMAATLDAFEKLYCESE